MDPEGEGPRSPQEVDAAREALEWVLGRLTVLEYLILFLAAILALLGGALVAWVLTSAFPISFRWTWAAASLLVFILPGLFVYLREFRKRAGGGGPDMDPESKEPHG